MITRKTLLDAAARLAGEMNLNLNLAFRGDRWIAVDTPDPHMVNVFTSLDSAPDRFDKIPGIHVTIPDIRGDLYLWFMPGTDATEGFEIKIRGGEILQARAFKGKHSHEMTRALALITGDPRNDRRGGEI